MNTKFYFLLIFFMLFFAKNNYAQLKKYNYTQYAQAQKDAQEQQKEIMIILTGSTWCKPCIKMKRNVFENKNFIDYASKKFIFFEIDVQMPMNIDSENFKTYEIFKEKYQMNAFPTLVITDAQGNKKRLIEKGLTSLEKTMKELKK